MLTWLEIAAIFKFYISLKCVYVSVFIYFLNIVIFLYLKFSYACAVASFYVNDSSVSLFVDCILRMRTQLVKNPVKRLV
jgi:hypothetical protein